jgi:hypothetical protein
LVKAIYRARMLSEVQMTDVSVVVPMYAFPLLLVTAMLRLSGLTAMCSIDADMCRISLCSQDRVLMDTIAPLS